MGFALHVVEQENRPAIEVLLQAGDLQIGIDFLVGDQHIPLTLQPRQHVRQGAVVFQVGVVFGSGAVCIGLGGFHGLFAWWNVIALNRHGEIAG